MGEKDIEEIKDEIYSSFSNTASSIGYDEIHGRIIAALIMDGDEMSLQELSEETGYSSSSISLSLDLLEVLGIIEKVKKKGDRKLYVKMEGDILEGLKQAIVIQLQKTIAGTIESLGEYEGKLEEIGSEESEGILEGLTTLNRQMRRLESYVDKLSEVEIPKD
ncbi:MAG: MarR family transcriptional regulator [Candidatus Aenigmatarchaeota archaeon]